MNQHLNLTISNPCPRKFNYFKKTSKGGFCNSCQKEVIDFRQMSDQELRAYFENSKKNICGNFKVSQVNFYPKNHEIRKAKAFNFIRIVALAVFSLTSLHQIQGQEVKPKTEIVQTSQEESNYKTQKSEFQGKLLSGTVFDESGALPGTNIVLKGTSVGTVTNFDGEFEFPKPLNPGDVLVISFLGYATQNIVVNDSLEPFHITMLEDTSCVLMGEVELNEAYISRTSLWQRIKRIF